MSATILKTIFEELDSLADPNSNACIISEIKPCRQKSAHSSRASSLSAESLPSSCTSLLESSLCDSTLEAALSPDDFIPLGCLFLPDPLNLHGQHTSVRWQEVDFQSEDSQLILQYLKRPGPLKALWQAKVVRVVAANLYQRGIVLRIYVLGSDIGWTAVERLPSSRSLRGSLEELLLDIDVSPAAWSGNVSSRTKQQFDPWASDVGCSLNYLFNTLPSPDPCPAMIPDRYTRAAVQQLLDQDKPLVPGLRSCLYPFQRRAVAAMLQREAAPTVQVDPRMEKRTAPDGSHYYYEPRRVQFRRTPSMYESTKSGILAETMGLGKTIICLALILATKGHLPQIPPHYSLHRPSRQGVPSLVDLAVATAGKHSIPIRSIIERFQRENGCELSRCMENYEQRPIEYLIPHIPLRMNRRTETPAPTKKRLCSATIVVVPPNLVHQWKAEIEKHTDSSQIKVLICSDTRVKLPPAAELAKYDIILFSKTRFEMERKDGSDKFGRTLRNVPAGCQCPYTGATRNRACTCLRDDDIYSSPLKELHFLRIIADEGHNFSSKTSDVVKVAEKLVTADRRWVVSGTPGKHKLVSVDVELAAQADEQDWAELSTSDDASTPSGDSRQVVPHGDALRQSMLQKSKAYNKEEDKKGAVHIIGLLINHFLQMRPWAESQEGHGAEWEDYVYRHESYRGRTHSSFSICLQRVLEPVVIKTRPEDVDRDITLPPLTHKVTYLEPSFYDRLTANLFVLFLTANAVTSERADADYLFHKNSVKARNRLLTNLRQSAFYWTGFIESDVVSAVDYSERYLAKEDTKCSTEDHELLESCLRFARFVLSIDAWKKISTVHEIGLFVRRWPEGANSFAWSLTEQEPAMIGATQLRIAQNFLNERLFEEHPANGMDAAADLAMSEAYNVQQIEREKKRKYQNLGGVPLSGLNSQPKYHNHASVTRTPTKASQRPSKPAQRSETSKESGKETQSSMPLTHRISRKRKRSIDNRDLPLDSPLAKPSIIGTTSAKLSYLLSRVIELHEQEKILIFYDGDNTAYYVAQCLELINIKHLIYAKSLSLDLKSKYIVTFDLDSTIRVLLMDIRCGALGLNVNAASRVFFINPVCRPDLEAQSIKRCHRIGQTRPVRVETLILRGSIEEKLFERSKKMSRQEHDEVAELYDDEGICSVIQNASMLPVRAEDGHGYNQIAPLENGMTIQIFGRKGRGDTKISGIDKDKEHKGKAGVNRGDEDIARNRLPKRARKGAAADKENTNTEHGAMTAATLGMVQNPAGQSSLNVLPGVAAATAAGATASNNDGSRTEIAMYTSIFG